MTKWKQTHSCVRPTELDTTSSQAVVYERKNIIEEQVTTENGSFTQWVYDERIYTKEEYQQLTSPTTQLIMQNISDLQLEIAELEANKNE